jgi:hypothetical protein
MKRIRLVLAVVAAMALMAMSAGPAAAEGVPEQGLQGLSKSIDSQQGLTVPTTAGNVVLAKYNGDTSVLGNVSGVTE